MAQSRPQRPGRHAAPAAASAEGLLTTAEAAAFLSVHPKQVYRLFERGLPHRRVGDEWRYDRAELEAWSRGGTSAVPVGTHPPSIVAGDGDLAGEWLLAMASSPRGTVFGAALTDRAGGLELLRRRQVLAAGYHGTTFPAEVPEGRMARLHLVRRKVGLAAKPSTRLGLEHLPHQRLASRPPTAGVRHALDEALRAAGLSPAAVARRSTLWSSHRDVVHAVLRGEADVGLTTGAWAEEVGLTFLALADEDYGLLLFADDLGSPDAVRLCETAQSEAYRRRLGRAAGYDARQSGRIHLDRVGPAGATEPARAAGRSGGPGGPPVPGA